MPGRPLLRRARSSSRARRPRRCCTPGASGRRRCPRTRRPPSRCCGCPPDPSLPEPLRGRFVVALRFTHLGPRPRAPRCSRRCGRSRSPLMDLVDEMPLRRRRRRAHGPDRRRCPSGTAASTLAALPGRGRRRAAGVAGPDVAGAARAGRDPAARRRDRPGAPGAQRRRPAGTPRSPCSPSACTAASPVEAVAAAGAAVVDALRPWTRGGAGQLPRPGRAGAGRPAVEPGGPGAPAGDPRAVRPGGPAGHEHRHRLSLRSGCTRAAGPSWRPWPPTR